MTISKLAEYILHQFSNQGEGGITPMKLQKLLFYVKAWGLVAGKKLVTADFKKWEYGPVNKFIYDQYKHHKSGPIPVPEHAVESPKDDDKQLIDFIVENYVGFHAYALSSMTHNETPWLETQQNDVISDEKILAYYQNQWFAQNFPLDENKPFYPVMSHIEYTFIFDMNDTDAKESMKFPSYEAYKKLKAETQKDLNVGKNDWLNGI